MAIKGIIKAKYGEMVLPIFCEICGKEYENETAGFYGWCPACVRECLDYYYMIYRIGRTIDEQPTVNPRSCPTLTLCLPELTPESQLASLAELLTECALCGRTQMEMQTEPYAEFSGSGLRYCTGCYETVKGFGLALHSLVGGGKKECR